MRGRPGLSAVTLAVAAGCLLPPATSVQAQVAVARPTGPGAAASASHNAPRPTKIRGWNAATRRVTPGTRLSDRIRVRSDGNASVRRIKLLRARRGSGDWRTVWRGRTGPRGRVTLRFTAPDAGVWKYRVLVPSTTKARGKKSATRRIVVWTPQPSPTLPSPVPVQPAPDPESLVYVTGDIGQCGGAADKTAALIDRTRGVVVATGDLAYPNGTDLDFANCYDPDYGVFKDITFPVPGNHEYNSDALAYFAYFGDRVGTPASPWYAVDIGAWRFYMLNSNCSRIGGCGVGSPQYTWLAGQLSADQPRCTAAVWHHPRWSSGAHGPDANTSPLYSLLADHGADLLLTGHEHNYERFARLNATGQPDPVGIREFVVGTGGQSLRAIPGLAEGSEVRLNDSHGVMLLTLGATGFTWRFQPTEPTGGTDTGSEACS